MQVGSNRYPDYQETHHELACCCSASASLISGLSVAAPSYSAATDAPVSVCADMSCLQLSWHVWPFLILGFNCSWVVPCRQHLCLSTTLARLLTASSGCCLALKIILLPVKQTFCLRSNRWTAPFKTTVIYDPHYVWYYTTICILHVPFNVGCWPACWALHLYDCIYRPCLFPRIPVFALRVSKESEIISPNAPRPTRDRESSAAWNARNLTTTRDSQNAASEPRSLKHERAIRCRGNK